MQAGTLQIDNVRPAEDRCADGVLKQINGLSQVFSVCVTPPSTVGSEAMLLVGNSVGSGSDAASGDASGSEDKPSASTSGPSSSDSGASNESSRESSEEDDGSSDSHRTRSQSSTPSPQADLGTSATTIAKSTNDDDTSFPAIIVVSLSCGIAAALTIGYFFFRRRRQHERSSDLSDGYDKPRRPLGSLFTSTATEDVSFLERSNSLAALASCSMITPPPEARVSRESQHEGGRASAPATPIGGIFEAAKYSYSNLNSPSELAAAAHGFVMSKSLQSLTGVTNLSFAEVGNPVGDRIATRRRLRNVLQGILNDGGTVEVNEQMYECYGALDETQYSFLCKCRPVHDASNTALWLKLFVEHDAIYAAKEHHVLQLLHQEPRAARFVPRLVDAQTQKKLDGVKCSALLMEMGSATTFLHVVRGQMEKSSQFSVAHQLSRVVHALECLHSRQYMHGSLNMESIVIFDDDTLKFRDLEHATRFKGDIHGYASASAEFLPPEMARHVLCDGYCDGSDGSSTSADPIAASYSFDIWSLGIAILKMYSSSKHLDEFSGCNEPADILLRLAEPSFNFERSIALYVPHEDVKDLARQCLQREPSFRPRIDAILRHPVFQAHEHELSLQEVARPSFVPQRNGPAVNTSDEKKAQEDTPPSLWFFLPPKQIGLDQCLSIDEWVAEMNLLLQERKPDEPELALPLLFMCETSMGLSRPCDSTGPYKSRLSVPLSLLSLVVPLVQETILFLEAKAILSELHIAQVSGLGKRQWSELMKFYRALEKMLLAPVSAFTLMMLKPLEEMLANGDRANAQQVLDEVTNLAFSQEKRDHVQSLLDIIATTDATAATLKTNQEWSGLRKCHVEREPSVGLCNSRWLCRDHLP